MPPEVEVVKENHAGQPVIRYRGTLIRHDEELAVARCPWSLPHTHDLGAFLLEPGDVFTEHYYRARWFNVFQIADGAGRLKGWYCNITYPAQVAQGAAGWRIHWRDLALDLLVLPDGSHHLLDEDEYAALPLSAEERAQAERAVETLLAWVAEGRGPFADHRPSQTTGQPLDEANPGT
ncbi:MAG: DUF402 domain-containing protein [Chloroflexi bacterium]|nr:DUF402 domain-containing protein [Chloroflexota bacterium]